MTTSTSDRHMIASRNHRRAWISGRSCSGIAGATVVGEAIGSSLGGPRIFGTTETFSSLSETYASGNETSTFYIVSFVTALSAVAEAHEDVAEQRRQLPLLAGRKRRQDLPLHGHVGMDDLVHQVEALLGEADHDLAAVTRPRPLDEAPLLQPVDPVGDGAGGDHRLPDELAGGQLVRLARSAKGRQHVVHPALDAVTRKVLGEAPIHEPRQPRYPPDRVDRRHIDVGTDRVPLARDPIDRIGLSRGHGGTVPQGRGRLIISILRYGTS